MKVLVVEDSRFFAAALRKGLEMQGFEHDLAISRAEARHLLAENPGGYFAALVDLHLPDCTDGEVVDDTLAAGIATIVFTSAFDDDLREMILAKPVVDYVPKNNPTSIEQVMRAVERLASNSRTAVLVVDDSRTARQIMAYHLGIHRFTVLEASNGQQALEILESRDDIRVTVVDYNMAGMDGCALTTAIRRRWPTDRMVVIGLSAYGNNILSARFMKAGASDFIAKPFIPEELFCRLYQNLDLVDHIGRLRQESAARRHVQQDMAVLSTLHETIIATSPLGIAVYHGDGACVLANPALARMVGTDVERLRTHNFRTIAAWKKAGLLRAADKALKTGEQQRGAFDLSTSFGRRFWAEVDLSAFSIGGEPHLLAVFRDASDLHAAENKLVKEREKLLAVLNSAASAIITIDAKGIIQSVNPATERIFGWSVLEMVGRDMAMLMPPDLRQPHAGGLASFRPDTPASVSGTRREVRGLRKNGDSFPMELAISTVQADDGSLTFIGLVTDLSERHAAESLLRRLSSAVEHSSASVVITDSEGRIEYANPRLCATSGYSREEMVGQSPGMLKSGEKSREYYNEMWSQLKAGRVWHDEFRNRRKDGSEYWVKSSIDPVRDEHGHITHYVAVQEDVTELKEAKEQAERANQAKSEFLSAMSHELRTPLNAIIGFSQLMTSARKDPLSPKQHERAEMILTAGNQLLELINEILDLSRIEAGRLDLTMEAVPLAPLVAECLTQVREMAAQRAIVIQAPPLEGLRAHSDLRRLRQVLLNLLTNAIKYNRDGGRVTIAAEIQDGFVTVSVADTGRGIPPHRQNELFQPFNRLGAETTSIEGTGIGLVVTKSLVESMGGAIAVTSQVDVGTTFRVRLPLAAADEATAASAETPPAESWGGTADDWDGHGFRVLYVEDNPTNINLMRDAVAQFDNTVLDVAQSAEGGMILAQQRRPDLVLMDINLPGVSGIEATQVLKADAETAAIPVAILSANVLPEIKREAKRAGADYFLTKPLILDDLGRIIRHIVESRHG